MCMPLWHLFFCVFCTYRHCKTKFCFCFLDNLKRENTNVIRIIFEYYSFLFTAVATRHASTVTARRPHSLAYSASDPQNPIVNEQTDTTDTHEVPTAGLVGSSCYRWVSLVLVIVSNTQTVIINTSTTPSAV